MTDKEQTEWDLSHIKDVRHLFKWCYDHGLLKGAYPQTDVDKSMILDAAEARLKALTQPEGGN